MSARRAVVFVCLVLLVASGPMSLPNAAAERRDLGHEILAPNDGWASLEPGVTGGSAAAADQVYTVTNRTELIAALNNGVYVNLAHSTTLRHDPRSSTSTAPSTPTWMTTTSR